MFEQLLVIEAALPFEILGYDSDNGGEVLNEHIYRYFVTERIKRGLKPVQVTRSRFQRTRWAYGVTALTIIGSSAALRTID